MNTRRRPTARPATNPSDDGFPSRSRLPFVEFLLSLRSGDAQLRKAVQRSAHAEKPLKDAGEQKCAAACELVLVDLHVDPNSACKAYALLGDQPCEVWLAFDVDDALNHVLRVCGPAHIVESQYLLQRALAPFEHGQVIERQVRNQPPQRALAQCRTHRRRGLA